MSNRRQIAEHFVICGLPESPTAYNISKLSSLSEEIKSDASDESCYFQVPIVDIQLISLKNDVKIPNGYHVLQRTCSETYKANIRGPIGDEVYICFRRGWDRPPISSILYVFLLHTPNRIFEKGETASSWDPILLEKTYQGKSANLRYQPFKQTYLSYRTASPSSGIDELAVVDMCLVLPERETCPPAFNQISTSLNHGPGYATLCLCYRKSVIKHHSIPYEPEVLFHYRVPLLSPETMSDEAIIDARPLSDVSEVAHFCLPWGASIESWSDEQEPPQPRHVSFVLTNETSQRLYGIAFTFHEPYEISKLDKEKCYLLDVDPELVIESNHAPQAVVEEQPRDPKIERLVEKRQGHFLRSRVGNRVIGVTKSICILSRWSLPVAFTNFLAFLYSRCLPEASKDRVPLERYLTHFLFEVPFPDLTTPNVLVELCAAPILVQWQDEKIHLASNDCFFHLLYHLGVDVTLKVFMHMLTEQKVLLTSVKHYLLTQIAEALISIIFPLRWSVVYIPFIAVGRGHVIQSPSPYLIGVDCRVFDFFRLSDRDITCVDLETRHLMLPQSYDPSVLDVKVLPEKPLKRLRSKLNELHRKIVNLHDSHSMEPKQFLRFCLFTKSDSEQASREFRVLEEKDKLGGAVQQAFRLFMAHLLKDYRQFLVPAENGQLFDRKGFLETASESKSRDFYRTLFATQHWADFVHDRSYLSLRESALDRFDQLIAANACSAQSSNPLTVNLPLISGKNSVPEPLTNPLLSRQLQNNGMSSSTCSINMSITLPNTKFIGPPIWPIPSNVIGFHEDVANFQQFITQRNIDYGSMPATFDVKLLNRLAICAHHLRAIDVNQPTVSMNDAVDSDRISDRVTSQVGDENQSSRKLPPSQVGGASGAANVDSNTGFIGLPTKYPLPIDYSTVLRRSWFEIQETSRCCQLSRSQDGATWCNLLIGTLYSLWFMLLPSFLASIRCESSTAGGETDSNKTSEPMTSTLPIEDCISEAIEMSFRLDAHQLSSADQVRYRILLVLLYQHRPKGKQLSDLMDKIHWNNSSWTLKNQVYTCYREECEEMERQARWQVTRNPPPTHNRSNSTTLQTNLDKLGLDKLGLETAHSEPSLLTPQQPQCWNQALSPLTGPSHHIGSTAKSTLIHPSQSQPVERRNNNNELPKLVLNHSGDQHSLSSCMSTVPAYAAQDSGDNLSNLDGSFSHYRSSESSLSNFDYEHRDSVSSFRSYLGRTWGFLQSTVRKSSTDVNSVEKPSGFFGVSSIPVLKGSRFFQDRQRPSFTTTTSSASDVVGLGRNSSLPEEQLYFKVGGELIIGKKTEQVIPATLSTYVFSVTPIPEENSTSPCVSSSDGATPQPITNSSTSNASDGATGKSPNSFHYPKQQPSPLPPSRPRITQFYLSATTCNTCPHCERFVYDEEIMASWSANVDSSIIACPFCDHHFVPTIVVRVFADVESTRPKISRKSPSSVSLGEGSSSPSTSTSTYKPILECTHPYFNPLHLRGQLEQVLEQEDGAKCFHVTPPKNSLLYRHEDLTWNLVWYIHRLGLPTHLLDPFPLWLQDKQSELRRHGCLANSEHIKLSGNNMLSEAIISADIPMYIILRWNIGKARSSHSKPFYSQWLVYMREWKMSPAGSTHPHRYNPSPVDFNLYESPNCIVKKTIAELWDSISKYELKKALEALIRFRCQLLSDKSRSDVDSPQQHSEESLTEVNHRCTELHKHAWCLHGSLYREIRFFAAAAFPDIKPVDLDEQYNSAYDDIFNPETTPFLYHSDCAPDYVARACRAMLRPLSLIP